MCKDSTVVFLCDTHKLTIIYCSLHDTLMELFLHRCSDSKTASQKWGKRSLWSHEQKFYTGNYCLSIFLHNHDNSPWLHKSLNVWYFVESRTYIWELQKQLCEKPPAGMHPTNMSAYDIIFHWKLLLGSCLQCQQVQACMTV